jgi:GNAT superfamily N-acetyltransferase
MADVSELPPTMPVWLLRKDMKGLPEVEMPAGYRMRAMTVADAALWEEVWLDAEPYVKIEAGLFMRQFSEDEAAIPQRCFLLIGPDGSAQGTISAWHSKDFKGGAWGRIHWVAVKKASQGAGLARAMMGFAMKKMAQWHDRAYLDTSIGRVGAIKVYLDFGFVPDMEAKDAAAAWGEVKKKLDHPALKGL